MEDIFHASCKQICKWTPEPRECTDLKFCKTTDYGDIWIPKEITDALLKSKTIDDLNKHITSSTNYPEQFFSKLTLNRQRHLCLSLNRPFVFTKLISDIVALKEKYGTCTDKQQHNITLVNHVLCRQEAHGANCIRNVSIERDMSLDEGRSFLMVGLLANLLSSVGYSVCVYPPFSMDGVHGSSPHGNLFSSFLCQRNHPQSVLPNRESHVTVETFVSSFQPHSDSDPNNPDETGAEASQSVPCNMLVDAKAFAIEHKLIGKGGYERNIDKIKVTDDKGQLTHVACVACDVCKIPLTDHVTIHVAQQQRSYHTQQTMILADMFNQRKGHRLQQSFVLTSGVGCVSCSGSTLQYTIADLFRDRFKQMSGAFVVKYGAKAEGPQLQQLAGRIAEAVVKFELLSHDPTSTVKIEVPEAASVHSHSESDVRFAGAFVLYNYARLATLVSHHRQACEQGTYPPLPPVDTVDFSLLKEEEEWQLLFHYVLQYPLIVKEAAQMTSKGVGVHINLGLKKVCQFLTKFCHSFSSYYSRTKVLMPPEPHLLPLIHARLYLMMTVKQVMYNALALLAIEPLEQL